MGFPTRIGIATGGYRRGDSNPGKVCIATDGYRCLEPAASNILDGDGGAGAVTRERDYYDKRYRPREVPQPQQVTEPIEDLALLAVIAIEEHYD